ncbi:chromo domain-containing protein [Trichonephila clavipes]|uniref:Chromo domain-containing protein n=1 Tax=Trichonephila clavipes TaxID=2585209 RepID=A0A8X6WH81_TRICX|nr:chromo domain-containing protein [Trichonephila clavipes]
MRKKKVPESLEELPSGLFSPERHIQITSENFIDFTFKRIKYSPDKEPTFKEITISREQWAEMIKKYGAIENAAIDNVSVLKDLQGEEIKGTYYEAELQKVVDSGLYPVENVIKQRKRGGITEYFVKLLGYPEKFNDWVTDIQKV